MAFCGTSSQFGTVVFNSEKAFQKNDLCSPNICNFILGKQILERTNNFISVEFSQQIIKTKMCKRLTAHTDSAAGDKQMHFGNSSNSVQDCYQCRVTPLSSN